MKQMYEWITKKWTPVGGACPLQCSYCLVNSYKRRFPAHRAKYSGEPRLVGPWPRFKAGDVVFVGHMTDLFAMPPGIVEVVLAHCCRFYEADYVFQTKVPGNILFYNWDDFMPPKKTIGTTLETDTTDVNFARDDAMWRLMERGYRTFVTVEPIMRFTPAFAQRIIDMRPSFVNIGADSKKSGLPEPTADEVRGLIEELRVAGIEVREKPNLARITGKQEDRT